MSHRLYTVEIQFPRRADKVTGTIEFNDGDEFNERELDQVVLNMEFAANQDCKARVHIHTVQKCATCGSTHTGDCATI